MIPHAYSPNYSPWVWHYHDADAAAQAHEREDENPLVRAIMNARAGSLHFGEEPHVDPSGQGSFVSYGARPAHPLVGASYSGPSFLAGGGLPLGSGISGFGRTTLPAPPRPSYPAGSVYEGS
jgi:hypothetical protein